MSKVDKLFIELGYHVRYEDDGDIVIYTNYSEDHIIHIVYDELDEPFVWSYSITTPFRDDDTWEPEYMSLSFTELELVYNKIREIRRRKARS